MTRAAVLLALMAVLPGVRRVSAQDAAPGRVAIGAALVWMGSASAGSADAAESTGSGGSSAIFSTTSTLAGASGVRLTAGVRATRAIELEGFASYTKPALEIAVSSDIENAAPTTARETVRQYIIGGGVLWTVPKLRAGDRVRVFVGAHAAYLRQLHEGNTLAVTGQSYDAGGGVKYLVPLRRRWPRAYGVRGDVGIAARTKGVFFDSRTRFSPTAAAAFVVRF